MARNPLRQSLYAFLALLILAGCAEKDAKKNSAQKKPAVPIPVETVPVVLKAMPVKGETIGNVEAYSTVSIKSRIDGLIFKVHFKEGQMVHQGDLLFEIDPRDYEAQLRQAEANLARDKAQLEFAFTQEQRYQTLFQEGVVSKELYVQVHTNLNTTKAMISADEAAIESAKVKLDYCKITSPIDGVTGKLLIHEGNMIKANDVTPLVIINKIAPIYVIFSVLESQLSAIQKYKASGSLKTLVSINENKNKYYSGDLVFIDNTVDSSTGTIKLKASFPNNDRKLWPGQFANVTLVLYQQKDAVVVPSQAIQVGPSGQYVFVVKPDNTIEIRLVTVDRADAAETIIAKGLAEGENVVTVGQIRLTAGAKVQPKTAKEG